MILKNGSFSGMAQDILASGSKIVVFGIGVVGLTITPQILSYYKLDDLLYCCIDNDETKWNTTVMMCGRKLRILPPRSIERIPGRIAVLITMSRYSNAFEQLGEIRRSENFSCYIIPALCINDFSSRGGKGIYRISEEPLIPKKIHYMWLGGKPIPANLQKCISSWKKFCPEYEIIRWDETNYDVHKNSFVAQAYDNKMYGFVPDYARLELLYEYGGIYLDTDVELVRNLDELLYQEAFCGVEKWQVLNFGGCSGAVKGHVSLEPFLDVWSKRKLIRTDGSIDRISSGLIDTSVAIHAGYQINGTNQMVNGMNIYTYDYFHPYDYMSGKTEMTSNTFSIHHFNGGWLDKAAIENNQRTVKQYDEFFSNAVVV